MNKRIERYNPNLLKFIDDGKVIDIFENPVDKIDEVILEEIKSNLIGDLMVHFALVITPLVFMFYDVNFNDTISKVVFIALGVLMFLGGVLLIPETILKLKSSR